MTTVYAPNSVSNSAAFLYGALGGVTAQTLLALASFRDVMRGEANLVVTPVRVLALLAITVTNAVLAGVVTLFLLSGSDNVSPAAAVMIGLGWSALLPTITRFAPSPGTPETERRAREEATSTQYEFDLDVESRQTGSASSDSEAEGWFTTERVQVLLSSGGFVLALLTFLFK
jgi:hypothetical protein